MLLFLDFDGVLRRAGSPEYQFDADCLEQFQETLRVLSEVEIVMSSSWKEAFSLNDIKRHFVPDIASRIIGVTPGGLRVDNHQRHREVFAFLRRHGWEQRPWVAIDDDPENYRLGANVVVTEPTKGFDRLAAASLIRMARKNPNSVSRASEALSRTAALESLGNVSIADAMGLAHGRAEVKSADLHGDTEKGRFHRRSPSGTWPGRAERSRYSVREALRRESGIRASMHRS